jgi:hypothetical protein
MDKLILLVTRLGVVLLVVAGLTLSVGILLDPCPALAAELSGSGNGTEGRLLGIEHLTLISRIHEDIQSFSKVDNIPPSRIFEEIGRRWRSEVASQRPDSVRAGDALIERLFRHQINHVTALLSDPVSRQDASSATADMRLDEVTQAVSQLTQLSPLVLAARDSIRSSLLVISSVACACELRRCSRMTELFTTIHSATLIGPIAVVDITQVPPLEDLLGQIIGPYWILFNEDGDAATVIERASDAEDVRASVVSWLGTPQVESYKEE